MIRKSLLFAILGITCWVSVGNAEMNRQQFLEIYHHYYQNPSVEQLKSAFNYFITPQPNHPLWQNEYEENGYARFFSILAVDHPELWRLAEKKFPNASWKQKVVLLAVFRRASDEQLRANMQHWADMEEDDDKRIFIEQASFSSTQPVALFDQPIRTRSTVSEQWAFFYAQGNTTVVSASIDLLSNTTVGYCVPFKKGETAKCILYPREKKLREYVTNLLLQQSIQHPKIQAALMQQTWLKTTPQGQAILDALAYQALELNQANLARTIFEQLSYWDKNSDRYLHFEGAVAALSGQIKKAGDIVNRLKSKNPMMGEWLRAYIAYQIQRHRETSWKQSAIPAGGRTLTRKSCETLEQTKHLGIYELWRIEELPVQETSNVLMKQMITLISQPDQRNITISVGRAPEYAWLINEGKLWRWTPQYNQWIQVENKLVYAQISKLTGLEETKTLLQSQYPAKIFKIVGEKQDYAGLVYKNIEQPGLLKESLGQVFKDNTVKISQIRCWIDSQDDKILRMQFDVDIYKAGKKAATGTLDRIFYEFAANDLDWVKDVNQ